MVRELHIGGRSSGEMIMATILEFRSDRERVPERRRVRRTGEIVIFPGVRYERHRGAAATVEAAAGGVKRDLLQLVE